MKAIGFDLDFYRGKRVFVLYLFFDKTVDSIKSDTAVVADYTASSVSIGKTRYDVTLTSGTHLVGVCSENTIVVRCAVFEARFYLLA